MLVIRENSEGEYVNQGGRLHRGTADEVATQLEGVYPARHRAADSPCLCPRP
ncbi:hypothetical protein ULG90_23640 [Halopseudomonas pachastrellae]|nr:hypothetical protein ULG90_23640 [Halopseudomonas pachastrellae]